MRLTADQIQEVIPFDDVHKAFLRRDDIKSLARDEQERRWAEHRVKAVEFLQQLAGLACYIIE